MAVLANRQSVAPALAPSIAGVGRVGLAAAAVGGEIFIIGGHDGEQPLKTTLVFEPDDRALGQGIWREGPSMLARRSYLTANAIGGQILVVGGSADGRALNTLEVFDATETSWNKWYTMPPMQLKRTLHAATAAEGKLFVCGGFDGVRDLNRLEIYDTSNNSWQWGSSMDTGRSYHALVATAGKLYAIGGQDRRQEGGARAHSSVEFFDFWSERWYPGPEMCSPKGRLALAAGVLHGEDGEEMIYACGGSDGEKALATVECLDVQNGVWSEAPPMNAQRLGHAVAVVDNVLYAVGGSDGKEPHDTYECYDPKLGRWSPLFLIGASPVAIPDALEDGPSDGGS